jgi:serine phosphatase RsbU (regulator of sigma subunit)
VLVDGQGSGVAAKMLSNAVSSKAVAMLKEGARDGTVARATHDYLHHYRGGKVSATLDLVSVDLASTSVIVSRNSHCPLLVRDADGPRLVSTHSGPIGPHRHTRPEIVELPMSAGLQLVAYTDGILTAGHRAGRSLDLPSLMVAEIPIDAHAATVADLLLAAAIAADDGRPADDMTVVALTIHHREEPPGPLIRRMHAVLPLDGFTPRRW